MYQGLAAGRYNRPMGATFPDDPIPPQFVHLFQLNKHDNNCIMAELFLKHQGRKMEGVLGDGNCLFHMCISSDKGNSCYIGNRCDVRVLYIV